MNIVLTGSLSIDQIMSFKDRFENMIQVEKLHLISISVLLDTLKRTRGGIAGNIAYSLSLLGEKPTLLASVGKDQKEYISDLSKRGIQTKHVHFSDLPTATFTVFTDENDCQIGGFYPGAMSDASSLDLTPFANTDSLVVLSSHDPSQMATQITQAAAHNIPLCFDVGQQVIMLPATVLRAGLKTAKVLILNDYEMGVLSKRTKLSEAAIKKMVDICIITLGEKGAAIYSKKTNWQEVTVSAVKVATVVDPTGAGDAFRAGFLYGYVRDWPAGICAQLGATVASFAIEQLGAQEHVFTKLELNKRYLAAYNQALPE